MQRIVIAVAFLALALSATGAHADEGMWLFSHPPAKLLKERYDFSASPEWYLHLQKSCVRFSTGGSGSIVSADGLVFTNHHVGSDMLERLSSPDRNLLELGFWAKTREEELPCPDLELLMLVSTEDVTARVRSAVQAGMASAEAESARKKMIGEIQLEAEKTTGLDCKVVTLYQGGAYHLYRYKRFTEIRLVFAPEQPIAFFGGDTDNFEYPRHDFDICFFRIYEGGKPLRAEHHLRWSKTGCKDGDLVFVAGHPGSTDRLDTIADLRFQRDISYPATMRRLWRREVQLQTFAARSREHWRLASGDLFGVQNSRKANGGTIAGLHDPALMRRKELAEEQLRQAVFANPEYKRQWGDAWDLVAEAKRVQLATFQRNHALGALTRSDLFAKAQQLVRAAAELPKPNADRLPEFRDSELDSLELSLLSPAPIYPLLETDRLWSAFSYLIEELGGEDPLVASVLAGKSPRARAEELVAGTKLLDAAARKALFEGGAAALAASEDGLLRLAAQLDPELRALRKQSEDEVEARERDAYSKLAAAAFAVGGDSVYPDATFTLRLSFGTVRGYREDGVDIAPFTDFAGLYRRADERAGQAGFALPESWLRAKQKLRPATPMNFVSTCDIIGGNSGSPTVDRAGELVGIIFDSNLAGLVFDIAYTDDRARAISVDSRCILAALRTVYGAEELAAELERR